MMKLYKSWDDVPQLLHTRDLVTLLGVKRHTIQNWLAAGILPGKKLGETWIVDKLALQQLFPNSFSEASGEINTAGYAKGA